MWHLWNILIGKWSISYFNQILTNTNLNSFDGSRTIVPKENWPTTLKLILTLSQTLTLTGGQFSSGAIVRITFWHRHNWIKECIHDFKITVAVVRRCSLKFGKFHKKLSVLQFLFIKAIGLEATILLLKRDSKTGAFLWNLRNF